MKIFYLLFVLFIPFILNARAIISPSLYNEISQKQDYKGLISINLFLTEKFDFDELEASLQGKSFDYRVKSVRNNLQAFAKESQADILNLLRDKKRSKPGHIGDINPVWIVNMINIEASVDLIHTLSERFDINYIDLNEGRYYIDKPVMIVEDDRQVKNNTEQSLFDINAHKLWAMGYTGRNLIFLSMDTGVFPNHPSISDNFAGNYFPMEQCWYGIRNDYPADHSSSSHGTHTTGTVLGLDPVTNDTIGVAYNSKWIASDPVASSETELLNPLIFMEIFQWVMNPDGDPETTDDVPRVINNSWGFGHDLAELFDACNMEEAEVLIAIEAAGICSPFSAGNNGPGASTTGFPAMLAYNEVNPMAVGALNANNTIASFSSRGPTPCVEEDGPLKIKPEVCAPGVNIRSCSGTDSYSFLSGTSMACPHVAGALLLLAEAFPNASAFELKNSLYQTAIDLGEEGENNIYGKGMIDAYAAFNFLSEIYEPKPPVNQDYNLSVNINNPVNNEVICHQQLPNIIIKIENEGLMPIDTFVLSIHVNDQIVENIQFDIILESGELFYHEINELELEPGKNSVWARVKTINEYEEYCRFNNNHIIYFYQVQNTVAPFYEDFLSYEEDLSDFPWIIQNPDNKNTWEVKMWGDEDLNKALSMDFLNYGSRNWEENYALSKEISIPDWDNVYLNFTYSYKKRMEYLFKDSLLVQISNDCGQNFSTLFRDGGETLTTVPGNSDNNEFIPMSPDEFDTVSIAINEYKNQDVIIRIKSKNDRGSAVFIDMIEISDNLPSFLENIAIKQAQIKLYPNPGSNYVNYNFIGVDVSSLIITVVDIYGREIFKTASTHSGTLNTESWSDGIYFIRFESDDFIRTEKFVKTSRF